MALWYDGKLIATLAQMALTMVGYHQMVQDAAALRLVTPTRNLDFSGLQSPSPATYMFDATSLAADDGDTVIKPTAIPPASPGRWIKITPTGGGGIPIPPGSVQGDVLIRNAVQWTRLPAGLLSQPLESKGAGADAAWGPRRTEALVDPTVTDDSGSGYTIGSRWINTVQDRSFVCLDATPGSAAWRLESPTEHWIILVRGAVPRTTLLFDTLAAALAVATDEDTILLPPGSVPVNTQLSIPSNVMVIGMDGPQGKGTYLNMNVAANPAIQMYAGSMLRNLSAGNVVTATTLLQAEQSVILDGVRLSGGDASNPTIKFATTALSDVHAKVIDLEVVNTTGIGMQITGSATSFFRIMLSNYVFQGVQALQLGNRAVVHGTDLKTIPGGISGPFIELNGVNAQAFVNGMLVSSASIAIYGRAAGTKFVGSSIHIKNTTTADIQLDTITSECYITDGYLDPTSLTVPAVNAQYVLCCIDRNSSKEGFRIYCGSGSSGTPFFIDVDGNQIISVDTAGKLEILGSTPGDILYRGLNPGGRWERLPAGISGQVLQTKGTVAIPAWVNVEAILGALTADPTGFPNRTDSLLSFNDVSRVLTITPTGVSFDVYHNGNKFTFSAPLNATAIPDTSGIWYYYFDSTGTLQRSQTPWDLSLHAPAAIVYWNAEFDYGILSDERHGLVMDWRTHEYLHTTRGTAYGYGLDMTGYLIDTPTDAAVQVGVSGGQIDDEDIKVAIVPSAAPANPFEQILADPAQIPVYHRRLALGEWNRDAPTVYPFKNATGGNQRVAFNEFTGGVWTQTEAANGNYVAYWICATTTPVTPIISIQGQRQDSNLTNARANNTLGSLDLGGIPFKEIKVLYRIIVETNNGFGNTRKAQFANVEDLRTSVGLPGGTFVPRTHGSLAGLDLDDHLQYFSGVHAGELNALTLKAVPVGADVMVLEDSAAAFAKVKTPLSALSSISRVVRRFINGEFDSNLGNYRVQTIAGTGAFRFSFRVPDDFASLISLNLMFIVAPGAAGPNKDIDLTSDYAALGEVYNTHSQSDTTTLYDFTGQDNKWTAMDISGLFSSLSAGDFCGLLVDNNAIGGNLYVLGINIVYNT